MSARYPVGTKNAVATGYDTEVEVEVVASGSDEHSVVVKFLEDDPTRDIKAGETHVVSTILLTRG